MREAGVHPIEARAASVLRFLDGAWVVPLALLATVALHIFCASHLIERSNQDRTRSDQGAEIWLARVTAHERDVWPLRSDGVRHPLWSWLARFVAAPDDQAFFQRGKWLNTGLACVFLAGLAWLGARSLGGLATASLLLLASLGILLVRGTFFQPEPLYYALSFAAAVCGWRVLAGGSWWYFPLLGVSGGFAMLAKPAFEPMAAAFIAALALATLLAGSWPLALRNLAGVAVALLAGAALMAPLGAHKKEVFGSAGFSYPKIWMWMDDFENEAWPWQSAHPGRAQLEAVQPSEWPSASWYLRRHSLAHAIERASQGTCEVFARFVFPEPRRKAQALLWKTADIPKWEQPLSHRGIYLLALLALPVLLVASRWREALPALRNPSVAGPLIFAVAAFAAYTVLYGWYYPIGRGDRFMGALWVPAIFLAAWLGRRSLETSTARWKSVAFLAVHGLVLGSLALQAVNLAVLLAGGTTLTARN